MRSFAAALRRHPDYFADAAVQAALDLGLPQHLAGARPPDELARAQQLDLSRLLRLGRVLIALGRLAESADGQWRWLGAAPPLPPPVRQGWGLLAEVIRSGAPLDASGHLDAYQQTMASDHRATAAAWAAQWRPRLAERGALLDVGAGLGTWARALLDAAPGWRAVLVDRPEVLALAAGAPRIRRAPGDATALPWRGRFDLVVSAHLLHHLGAQACAEATLAMARALRPGGWLSLVEVFTLPDQPAADPAIWFDLDMALYSPQGCVHRREALEARLRAAGLVDLAFEVLDAEAGIAELRARRPARRGRGALP